MRAFDAGSAWCTGSAVERHTLAAVGSQDTEEQRRQRPQEAILDNGFTFESIDSLSHDADFARLEESVVTEARKARWRKEQQYRAAMEATQGAYEPGTFLMVKDIFKSKYTGQKTFRWRLARCARAGSVLHFGSSCAAQDHGGRRGQPVRPDPLRELEQQI